MLTRQTLHVLSWFPCCGALQHGEGGSGSSSIVMGWVNDLHDSLSELVFNDGVVLTQDIRVVFEALEQPMESSDTEFVMHESYMCFLPRQLHFVQAFDESDTRHRWSDPYQKS